MSRFYWPWLVGWKSSGWNRFGVEVEQERMGKYRHRSFDDWLNPTEWIEGPHPICQQLRDEGRENTWTKNKKQNQANN